VWQSNCVLWYCVVRQSNFVLWYCVGLWQSNCVLWCAWFSTNLSPAWYSWLLKWVNAEAPAASGQPGWSDFVPPREKKNPHFLHCKRAARFSTASTQCVGALFCPYLEKKGFDFELEGMMTKKYFSKCRSNYPEARHKKMFSALTSKHSLRERASKLKCALTLRHSLQEQVSKLKSALKSRLKSALPSRHSLQEQVSKVKSALTSRHGLRERVSKLKSALTLRHRLWE
jgi:hypothetical protein